MRFVLSLRGVNMGTGNSLPMVEFRAMLEAAGALPEDGDTAEPETQDPTLTRGQTSRANSP